MSRKKKNNGIYKKSQNNYILFVEGYTEVNYFGALFQLYRISFAKVIKVQGRGKNWVEKAENYLKYNHDRLNYDSNTKVYVIFDKDNISCSQINTMQKIINKKKRWQLGISNCSFEVWLLAHFTPLSPRTISVSKIYQMKLEKRLSKYLKEKYSKNKRENAKQIQKILNSNVKTVNQAIANVSSIGQFKQNCISTDVGKIVYDIIS